MPAAGNLTGAQSLAAPWHVIRSSSALGCAIATEAEVDNAPKRREKRLTAPLTSGIYPRRMHGPFNGIRCRVGQERWCQQWVESRPKPLTSAMGEKRTVEPNLKAHQRKGS